MGTEIERKFLVRDPAVVAGHEGTTIRQGYLSLVPERTVRIRRAGERGFVTIKGKAKGASRPEYEYEIPAADADELLETLAIHPLVAKVRYEIGADDLVWQLDVFGEENEGLVVVEVELPAEDHAVTPPDWVGREVTGDHRYENISLVTRPYRDWAPGERDAS